MKNKLRLLLAALPMIMLSLNASAQLSTISIDPERDAEVIASMKERMTNLSRTKHRPSVALVLSGGGAKGAAHVGVLKYLEEQGIPVDMIFGTSMGGLIGGLYSMGYTADQIDTLLVHTDWNLILSDDIPDRYLSYERRKYKETYALSVPFRYLDKDMEKRQGKTAEEQEHTMSTVWSSLPAGYVRGLNIENLLSSLSVGYQDSIDFRELPIPFFCVASDLVSCTAKNWSSGSINDAMRSTMSIPGLFEPVRTNGMILIDGGTRNNFPTDLAREMGADIIIGVELSDPDKTYSEINNLGNLLRPMIDMLGRESFAKNVDNVDIFIKPDLKGYNMLSFDSESIAEILRRGYEAALAKESELLSIKKRFPDSRLELNHKRAVDIGVKPVQIRSIEFEGLDDDESLFVSKKLEIHAGDVVTKEDIYEGVEKIYATGAFKSVTFHLYGNEEPYSLAFRCEKGPVHRAGVGVRMDNEEIGALLLNVGFNVNNLQGPKADVAVKIGENAYLNGHFALDTPKLPTLNLDAKIYSTLVDLDFRDSGSRIGYWGHSERFYISNMNWSLLSMKLGIKNEYQKFFKWLSGSDVPDMTVDLSKYTRDYVSLFLDGKLDTYNDGYFPTRGSEIGFNVDWAFLSPGRKDFQNTFTAYLNLGKVFPIGSRFAIKADAYARFASVPDVDDVIHRNFVGGYLRGRYIEHQIPFIGFNHVIKTGDSVLSANIDFRLALKQNLFVTLSGAYLNSNDHLFELFKNMDQTFFAASLGAGLRTKAGPMRANVFWSDYTRKVGAFIGFGYDF